MVAMLKTLVPAVHVLQITFPAKPSGWRIGLCFIRLKGTDRKVAEQLINKVHCRVWFVDPVRCLVAQNEAATHALGRLAERRLSNKYNNNTRHGDGLPLRPLTAEWSRDPRNKATREGRENKDKDNKEKEKEVKVNEQATMNTNKPEEENEEEKPAGAEKVDEQDVDGKHQNAEAAVTSTPSKPTTAGASKKQEDSPSGDSNSSGSPSSTEESS